MSLRRVLAEHSAAELAEWRAWFALRQREAGTQDLAAQAANRLAGRVRR